MQWKYTWKHGGICPDFKYYFSTAYFAKNLNPLHVTSCLQIKKMIVTGSKLEKESMEKSSKQTVCLQRKWITKINRGNKGVSSTKANNQYIILLDFVEINSNFYVYTIWRPIKLIALQ